MIVKWLHLNTLISYEHVMYVPAEVLLSGKSRDTLKKKNCRC